MAEDRPRKKRLSADIHGGSYEEYLARSQTERDAYRSEEFDILFEMMLAGDMSAGQLQRYALQACARNPSCTRTNAVMLASMAWARPSPRACIYSGVPTHAWPAQGPLPTRGASLEQASSTPGRLQAAACMHICMSLCRIAAASCRDGPRPGLMQMAADCGSSGRNSGSIHRDLMDHMQLDQCAFPEDIGRTLSNYVYLLEHLAMHSRLQRHSA